MSRVHKDTFKGASRPFKKIDWQGRAKAERNKVSRSNINALQLIVLLNIKFSEKIDLSIMVIPVNDQSCRF